MVWMNLTDFTLDIIIFPGKEVLIIETFEGWTSQSVILTVSSVRGIPELVFVLAASSFLGELLLFASSWWLLESFGLGHPWNSYRQVPCEYPILSRSQSSLQNSHRTDIE